MGDSGDQQVIDREQKIIDLEQVISDGHQVRLDREQALVDEGQHALDETLGVSDGTMRDQADIVLLRRQDALSRRQYRNDEHQGQVDDGTYERGARQLVLDRRQSTLDSAAARRSTAGAARRDASAGRDTAGAVRRVSARARSTSSARRRDGRGGGGARRPAR